MENLYLCCSEEDYIKKRAEQFFEYQDIIKKDLERIRNLVSDYKKSKEKESLLIQLNEVIDNICCNRFENYPEMELEIRTGNDYLAFSYYRFDKDNRPISEIPSIMIISWNMKRMYFLDEIFPIIGDEEEDSEFQLGYDEATYYRLEKEHIVEYFCDFKEYTNNLFFNSFFDTECMVMIIEGKCYSKR